MHLLLDRGGQHAKLHHFKVFLVAHIFADSDSDWRCNVGSIISTVVVRRITRGIRLGCIDIKLGCIQLFRWRLWRLSNCVGNGYSLCGM